MVIIKNSEILIECGKLVTGFFEGDYEKAKLWFDAPNSLLGGMKPNDMIELGREKKLLKFIKTCLAENERE